MFCSPCFRSLIRIYKMRAFMLKPDETFLRIANPGRFAWNGNFHESSFKNDHVHRLLSSASPRFINTSFSLPLFVYLFKKKTCYLPPSLPPYVFPRFTLSFFRPYIVFRSTPPAIGCILQLTRGVPLPPPSLPPTLMETHTQGRGGCPSGRAANSVPLPHDQGSAIHRWMSFPR